MHGRAGTVDFLGVRFQKLALQDVASHLVSEDHARPFRYVITPNVQHMVALLDQPGRMKKLFAGAWETFCDSRVLRRLARLNGRDLSLVPGSDLTALLLDAANARAMKIAVIGPGKESVRKLAQRYPKLEIVSHAPPMGFMSEPAQIEACLRFVEQERAPLVFLAVGFPRQETLAAMLSERGKAIGIGLCIGASIDFLTGAEHRAPEWMQRIGLEWLHRLASDPRRLAARYLVECPRIFYLMLLRRNAIPITDVQLLPFTLHSQGARTVRKRPQPWAYVRAAGIKGDADAAQRNHPYLRSRWL